MATPALITLNGIVTSSPVVASPVIPSLNEILGLGVQASYNGSKSGRPTINATALAPFVIPLEGITKVRFFAVVVRGQQSFQLRLTSPNGGADQVVACSSLMVIHAPNVGDELTAIKISGVGDVEYLIAGDTA